VKVGLEESWHEGLLVEVESEGDEAKDEGDDRVLEEVGLVSFWLGLCSECVSFIF